MTQPVVDGAETQHSVRSIKFFVSITSLFS